MKTIETLAYAVEKIDKDVVEVKADVKALMLFMAVEKANAKKNTIILSSTLSLVVSLIVLGVSKLI